MESGVSEVRNGGRGDLETRLRSLESPKLHPRREVPLSTLGTFRLGGPAARVLDLSSPGGLSEARRELRRLSIPAVLIGEGSNILFSDQGWPGVLVRYVSKIPDPVEVSPGVWRVSAAVSLDALALWAAGRGLSGLEAFTGIPGTLGGAVVGNAGAWGVRMEQVLASVGGLDAAAESRRLEPAQCGFSYRDSLLKHNDFWVSDVELRLEPGDPETLAAERARILALRAERHPDWRRVPCIGSFFRNLEPSSAAERRRAAGWFLEQAGAKEMRVGGAGVFDKHANILVKRGEDCSAADVAALARMLQARVREVHGIDLVREVRYLGRLPGEPAAGSFH